MGRVYEEESEELLTYGLIAAAIPVDPPAEWFRNPELTKPTHLTISDDGRVFGHIAAWDVDHIGMPFGTRAPRSKSGYAYLTTGELVASGGERIPVGQLTLTGGHAPLKASASQAVKHYDDTASAIADIAAGEDQHGIWVAGALRPEVTPQQIRMARASSPSGDWRPIRGSLELVAVCQVNVPGFPIARAMVASGGEVTALVAAGASFLAKLNEPDVELAHRLAKLERHTYEPLLAAARARLAPAAEARRIALVASADAVRERVQALREYGEFSEHLHPRDADGRFRAVLARLTDALTHHDEHGMEGAEAAVATLGEAADAEDAGDQPAAIKAALGAASGLEDLAASGSKAASEAVDEIKSAVAKLDVSSPAGETVDIPEPIEKIVEGVYDQLRQLVPVPNPTNILRWLSDHGFRDVEDFARKVGNKLEQKLQPSVVQ